MTSTKRDRRSRTGTAAAERYDLWRHAKGRMAQCLSDGYYLEAIALQDSMICDRLESLRNIEADDVQMAALGRNISALRQSPASPEVSELAEQLDVWRLARNAAIHRMVKVGPDHCGDWDGRVAAARAAATDGAQLVDAVDRFVKHVRRAQRGPSVDNC